MSSTAKRVFEIKTATGLTFRLSTAVSGDIVIKATDDHPELRYRVDIDAHRVQSLDKDETPIVEEPQHEDSIVAHAIEPVKQAEHPADQALQLVEQPELSSEIASGQLSDVADESDCADDDSFLLAEQLEQTMAYGMSDDEEDEYNESEESDGLPVWSLYAKENVPPEEDEYEEGVESEEEVEHYLSTIMEEDEDEDEEEQSASNEEDEGKGDEVQAQADGPSDGSGLPWWALNLTTGNSSARYWRLSDFHSFSGLQPVEDAIAAAHELDAQEAQEPEPVVLHPVAEKENIEPSADPDALPHGATRVLTRRKFSDMDAEDEEEWSPEEGLLTSTPRASSSRDVERPKKRLRFSSPITAPDIAIPGDFDMPGTEGLNGFAADTSAIFDESIVFKEDDSDAEVEEQSFDAPSFALVQQGTPVRSPVRRPRAAFTIYRDEPSSSAVTITRENDNPLATLYVDEAVEKSLAED